MSSMTERIRFDPAGPRRVTFLLGPAGSGKTHRCLSEIREELLKDGAGPSLLFLAPKQATFQLERQLLSNPGLAGYTRLEILSFERLARYLLDELRAGAERILDEEGRRMVLRALLADRHAELRLFRATARLPGFARQLSEILRELQEQKLTPERLATLADRCDDEALAAKLHDFGLLLRHYQAWLEARSLQDPSQLVSLAVAALRAARREAAPVANLAMGGLWLDGFAELTPQELELLTEVIALSRRATLAFCLPGLPEDEPRWLSAWSGVARTVRSVWNQLSGISAETPDVVVLPASDQPTRFGRNAPLRRLAEGWAGDSLPAEPGSAPDGVRCVVCPDPVGEAIFAAREIRRYVREEPGRRYREVAVLLRSFEGYHDVISRVFGRYEIPFFLDRREPVAHHPLAELIRYALRTVAFRWQHDDWFGTLKTGLVPVSEVALDELENEALAHGWSGETWHQPLRLPDDPMLERRLERTRQQVLPAFELFARRLEGDGSGPDGVALAAALSGLWADLRVADRLERWETAGVGETAPARKYAAVHRTVWEQMQAWLQNLELAFAGRKLEFSGWLPIVESGLSGLTVGVIPPALDQVLVGTIDRSRNPDLRMAVVMGLNEGVFPAVPTVAGLLTGPDRDQLERHGVTLRANLRSQLSRERYLGYIALTRADSRLILTCAERDGAGRALNPSPFLNRVRQLLPGLAVEPGVAEADWLASEHVCELVGPAIRLRGGPDWAWLGPLVAGHPSFSRLERLLEPVADPTLSPALADALYGPVLRTSVSALEKFAACPFQFFVDSGLRAAERRRFEVDAREQGSFQHEILARFHEELRAAGLRWRDIAPPEARQRIGRIAAEVTRGFREGLFATSSEREAEARRLTRLLQDFIEIAVGWMGDCAFDPVRVELGFGRSDDPLPAWELELDSGHRLAFRGKIDRVDLAAGEHSDEALCMVVDYKSSARAVDALFLEHGIQIQLPAYLVRLRDLPDARPIFGVRRLRPAGIFYVNLRGNYENGRNRREVLAQAAEARRQAYRHTGRFNAAWLRRFDTRPEALAGEQFNYRLTTRGAIHGSCREPMDSDQFQLLLDGVADRIRSMGNRIFTGDIRVDPYRRGSDTPCDRCDARGICRIDPWTHAYRILRQSASAGEGK
ncbi:MAG: PD-(D/E)XK nuclease family protein [Verrucomicrobia bacterium]|nr:PD-(D/E)XK nuclease family protein [Verrucomicrobiota bacterium]